jgi:hypothetical protein
MLRSESVHEDTASLYISAWEAYLSMFGAGTATTRFPDEASSLC